MLSPDLILAKGDHFASGSRPQPPISLAHQDKAGELNLQEISAQALIQLSNSMYEAPRARRTLGSELTPTYGVLVGKSPDPRTAP